ncbi:MAG: hypothetical protein JWN00_1538 [Actinomycetia bacterium]|nr:hypothetical protein [Actinomycetes bacterium]
MAQSSAVTIKALLFDLDATLLDHDSAATTAIIRSLPGTDPSRITGRWAELEREAIDRYLSGETHLQPVTTDADHHARHRTRPRHLEHTAQADAWFTGYLAHYQPAWCAYPDIRPALDRLPLLKGVLANGTPGSSVERQVNGFWPTLGETPHCPPTTPTSSTSTPPPWPTCRSQGHLCSSGCGVGSRPRQLATQLRNSSYSFRR